MSVGLRSPTDETGKVIEVFTTTGQKVLQRYDKYPVSKHAHHFHYPDSPGTGKSFECDEQGRLVNAAHQQYLDEALAMAARGELADDGVVLETTWHTDCLVIQCDCGQQVAIYSDGTSCDRCETTYNSFGQRLAPPQQWQYEGDDADALVGW